MNKEQIYSTVLGPVVTEKATMGSEHGQVSFRVAKNATKPRIKEAVEELFSVKVKSVNTLRVKGKAKEKGHCDVGRWGIHRRYGRGVTIWR